VTHKGNAYRGEHPAIISQELWDKVHSILAKNHRARSAKTRAETPALLKGLIRMEGRVPKLVEIEWRKNRRSPILKPMGWTP
jgi:hypothetical protein